MEKIPSTPEQKESVPEKYKFYLDLFDKFLSLSDDPGRHISDKEKKGIRESGDKKALQKMITEKTGGEHEGIEYPASKYRKNAFAFFITPALLLLDSEPEIANKLSVKDRRRLESEIRDLMKKIQDLRIEDKPITKEEIDRGIAIINELKEIILKP